MSPKDAVVVIVKKNNILMMVVLNVYSQIYKQPNGYHGLLCKVLHVRWVWAIHCWKVPLSDQTKDLTWDLGKLKTSQAAAV